MGEMSGSCVHKNIMSLMPKNGVLIIYTVFYLLPITVHRNNQPLISMYKKCGTKLQGYILSIKIKKNFLVNICLKTLFGVFFLENSISWDKTAFLQFFCFYLKL